MNGTAIIAKREYRARIRSKGFWISTVALPVMMAAWLVLPSLVLSKARGAQRLAVVDLTGEVGPDLEAELGGLSREAEEQIAFDVRHEAPSGDPAELRSRLDGQILAGEIDAWLWIDQQAIDDGIAEYHAQSVSNLITQRLLERALSRTARRVRIRQAGMDPDTVEALSRSMDLDTVRVSSEGAKKERGLGGFALAIGLFMTLYMTTLIYGQQVMLGVLDEKSSRVVEVVVSSVRPIELLAGKLLGVGLIGLTQLGIWLATAIALTAPGLVAAASVLNGGAGLPRITLPIAIHFVLLFLLGYFLYASFYAMVGSAFNNPQEAQQLASLAVVFIVLPWIFFMPILNDPDSTLAVVTSLIPPFTPSLMMLRIATKMPPTWQILLGYVLTAAACVVSLWISARVYRIGILMYGKKPTFREIWRWMRYA